MTEICGWRAFHTAPTPAVMEVDLCDAPRTAGGILSWGDSQASAGSANLYVEGGGSVVIPPWKISKSWSSEMLLSIFFFLEIAGRGGGLKLPQPPWLRRPCTFQGIQMYTENNLWLAHAAFLSFIVSQASLWVPPWRVRNNTVHIYVSTFLCEFA